jgi:hypothetical protein
MHTLCIQAGLLTAVERAAMVEEFWASRNAWADAMNADRLSAWERKWAGIGERDLPPYHTRRVAEEAVEEQVMLPQPRVLPMRRRKEELAELEVPIKVPAYRFYWQPKSLPIPMP